jgi:hypothetical protein
MYICSIIKQLKKEIMTTKSLTREIKSLQKRLISRTRKLKAGEASDIHARIDALRGIRNSLENLEEKLMWLNK